MVSRSSSMVLLAMVLGMQSQCLQPALAGQSQAVTVKMGYFNLVQVKSVHPASAGLERMENTARELLRAEAEKGNALLSQMQKDGKPESEIKQKAQELQVQLNAKMEASSTLLMGNRVTANTEIAQAVNAVAKDKGLDLVVDANGIFSGGEKFANNGEDVTDSIIQRLVPSLPSSPSAPKPPESKTPR